MSRFLSKTHSLLVPYTPGEQPKDTKYIKLNTNESPYPPSSKAIENAAQAANELQLYPDPTCSALCKAFAKTLGVASDNVIFGNGSDEILQYAFLAFCDTENGALFPDITYGFYKVFAELYHIPYKQIPLRDDLTVNTDDYLRAGRTIFIANPNAPTGIALPLSEIERIASENPENVVVIDEAYVDFGAMSAVTLTEKYENLLVVQTFSKSRSMAGARLGMAIGNAALINDLNTIKYSLNPYNINRMTMSAGIGVLSDEEYTKKNCAEIIKTREYTENALAELGFLFPRSSANFIFARHESIGGEELYRKLKARGILVRHFSQEKLAEYNRITVGTKEQMSALIEEIKNILEEQK